MLKEQLNSVRDSLKKCKSQKRGLELKGELYYNRYGQVFFFFFKGGGGGIHFKVAV